MAAARVHGEAGTCGLGSNGTENMQRLVLWTPLDGLEGKTPSFGDFQIDSPSSEKLLIILPYQEGTLRIEFNDTRAFMTSWDGDPSPFLTLEEAISRPSDLCRAEGSRWLSSEHFSLDVDSSVRASNKAWEHFCIFSAERSLHVAARDDISALWIS